MNNKQEVKPEVMLSINAVEQEILDKHYKDCIRDFATDFANPRHSADKYLFIMLKEIVLRYETFLIATGGFEHNLKISEKDNKEINNENQD